MEWSILHALNDFLFRHDAIEDPLVFYIEVSEALFAVTLAVIFLLAQGPRWHEWRRAALAGAASAGIALLIASILGGLVNRARPFVADPGQLHLFVAHSPDASFPSDHATASFAIAVAILLRRPRWGAVAIVAATVLSLGRVAVGVHYPSDVLAGAALGALVALGLWLPPLRGGIDTASDRVGGWWDKAVQRTAAVLIR
jgi:undecaprenyl-diphosphatase